MRERRKELGLDQASLVTLAGSWNSYEVVLLSNCTYIIYIR